MVGARVVFVLWHREMPGLKKHGHQSGGSGDRENLRQNLRVSVKLLWPDYSPGMKTVMKGPESSVTTQNVIPLELW